MENACRAQPRLWGPSGRAQQGHRRQTAKPLAVKGMEGSRIQSSGPIESKESILEISGVREQIKKKISSADLNHRPQEMT